MIYETHCSQQPTTLIYSSAVFLNVCATLTFLESQFKWEKILQKEKQASLFSPQFTVSNVRTFIYCINCCQPILLYPQRKVPASSELNTLKH